MVELVIDANVLEHANNTAEARQASSINLIEHLLASDELMFLDEGFNVTEASNRSTIWSEYMARLAPGMLGRDLIITLATSGRVREHTKGVSTNVRRTIEKSVRKTKDRLYLKVASKTSDRILVSHDFEDFSKEKRKFFKKEIEVHVLEASDYLSGIVVPTS
ncbi:MAG: hypothetical protein IPM46_05810 [Flavobacteriales bacterium]|nr:hypothetical protein [Flavobacteriales bacterium]